MDVTRNARWVVAITAVRVQILLPLSIVLTRNPLPQMYFEQPIIPRNNTPREIWPFLTADPGHGTTKCSLFSVVRGLEGPSELRRTSFTTPFHTLAQFPRQLPFFPTQIPKVIHAT